MIGVIALVLGQYSAISMANPKTGTVIAGDVDVNQSHKVMNIKQNSEKAIMEWDKFDIASGEQVKITQPKDGVILIRVHPNQGASRIAGKLIANGKVVFVNEAGLVITPTAHVEIDA